MEKKKSLNIISVIMCTIIGAGFASGKEIYNFFARFGKNGIVGVIISGIFIGIIIYFTIELSAKNKIESNVKFMEEIRAPRALYNIVNMFLLISFYIMITGFAGYFKQEFNIPVYLASGVLCVLLYFVLISKIDGIVKINTFIAPVLILIIIYICVKYSYIGKGTIVENQSLSICIINAILYSSYNSIILIPILVTLSQYVKSKKENIKISVISSILVILLTFGIYEVLINSNINISKIEIPVVVIIDNKIEKYIYSIAIETAIFTSAISAGYGILENLNEKKQKNKSKYRKIVAIICILGVPISGIGFGNLVNTLYPVFGILGLIQIVLTIWGRSQKQKVKYKSKFHS